MNRKISLGMAISLMAIVATIAIALTYTAAINTFENRMSSITDREATYELINEIDAKIRQDYYGKVSEQRLRQGIAAGFIDGLNNTCCKYYTDSEWALENDRMEGYDFGLGIDISKAADGNIQINRVTSGSPAGNAGLKKGDIITYVNGVTVLSTGYDKAVSNISSAQTEVTLSVRRDDSSLRFTVTKASFSIISVEYRVINGNIGCITIYQFNNSTADQFNSALSKLQHDGIEGLIIDLRDSEGGSYEEACSILDTLLPAGNLMLFTDKSGNTEALYVSDSRSVSMPMAVLINGGTTGASEMFASAMADYGKAELFGTATAGELTVQENFVLSDGSAISITTGSWSTTRSSKIENGAVVPDFEVKLSGYQQENRYLLPDAEDQQLQTALYRLASRLEESAVNNGADVNVSGSDTYSN